MAAGHLLATNNTPPPAVDFTFNNVLQPGQTRRLTHIGLIVIDTTDDRRYYNVDIQYSTSRAPDDVHHALHRDRRIGPDRVRPHITATFTGTNDVKTIRLVSRLPFNNNTLGQNTYFNDMDIN